MPKTAYSEHFKRELDVEQLISLISGKSEAQMDQDLSNLTQDIRDWIRQDVKCAACGNAGAQIVSISKSRRTAIGLRQAHFRFVSPTNADAHHPFCDFYQDERGIKKGNQLVDFGSQNSRETRAIRKLVCRAIEKGVVSQSDIRAMRQWFFDFKVSNRFTLDLSKKEAQWLWDLRRHYHPKESVPFHPSHGEIGGYDWREAARSTFTKENEQVLKLVREAIPFYNEADHKWALSLIQQYSGQELFDLSVLEPFYTKTVELCVFIGQHHEDFKMPEGRLQDLRFGKIPVSLLAFSALLLFVSGWETDQAALKFALIGGLAEPLDLTLGNVIGLNPFYDFRAWNFVAQARRISSLSRNGLDYKEQLTEIEARLRAEHAAWKGTAGGVTV